jgi:hypothetical protein
LIPEVNPAVDDNGNLRQRSRRLFVPNFPQPQPCWPLSTQGPHATLLDGESPWWCCGISLRYAWRRHLVRTASAARMAQHAREAHRERGSLGAGRGPASLEETTALRIPTTPWTLCGFSSCGYQELGAWGPCGWWLRGPPLVPSACHPDQQVTGVEPGPPACKLAAESTFAIAEPRRDPEGGHRYRLRSGSLPYFSGVPTLRPEPRAGTSPTGAEQVRAALGEPTYRRRAALSL